jgi:hypothetical protein
VAFRNSHLDESALADVWTERVASGVAESDRPAEAHLRQCPDCRARYSAFSGWLDTMRADATAEADESLGGDRLSVQHAQIMRRLEALDQPGRIIAFPRFAQPTAVRPQDGRRWVAAAAAAGLVVGLGLGQVFDLGGSARPGSAPSPQVARSVGSEPSLVGLQPVATLISDETYLFEQDVLPSPVRVPESLQYLNAITPSARDYDPR